jgi:phosphatidylglycerophosphatase A
MSADAEPRASEIPAPAASAATRKPRFALFVATAAGLGYLPKAPGTWGSLGGLLVALLPWWANVAGTIAYISERNSNLQAFFGASSFYETTNVMLWAQIVLAVSIAILGVISADRAGKYWMEKDPQRVVIDEVSGQHLTLLFGCALPIWSRRWSLGDSYFPFGQISTQTALNWKYLLLGFILFRVFDIWKPFPARQAESLPGGWGIMADDWLAGVYAGIGLWIARAAGM